MPTTVITSVSDLTTWVAGIPADMGGATYRGEMTNTGEYSLSSALIFNGHSNGSIILTAAAGHGFHDNASVRSNALRYNPSNGVAITCSDASNAGVILQDPNFTLSGLQIKTTGATTVALSTEGGAGPVIIEKCIIHGNTSQVVDLANAVIRNCLLVKPDIGTSVGIIGLKADANVYSCTLIIPSDVTNTATNWFVYSGGSTFIMQNTAVFGTAAVSSATVTTTCATDVTPTSGFTQMTYGSQFENTTLAAGDWRVKAGADLIDSGTTDVTNGATDISVTLRPQGANYDIGAWEFLAESTEILMGQAVF